MASGKSGSISKGFVWIIILMLILGLGGFGISNFGGNTQSVGSVGDRDIGVNDYYRAIQQELRVLAAQTGQQSSLAEANQFSQLIYGVRLTDRVLGQMIATAAMDSETARVGISVGDEQVQEQLLAIPNFQGLDGNFDREAYRFALDRQGLNERDYETTIREETARTLLQAAVLDGIEAPDTMSETLMSYIGQRRSFEWVALNEDALTTPLAEPEEAQLQAYYDENPATFTLPETKRITYVLLTPDMLLDTVEVDEAGLRELYEERADEYIRPERRLVERLVFGAASDAEAASARLVAGEIDFDALVEERGLRLADTDLGDVSESELGDAGATVFELAEPGVTGVATSDLGPAIFRVNAILAAQETSFEDAEAELRDEFAADKARREIGRQIGDIEDLLAGGATLEELDTETEMELGQIDWSVDSEEGIAGYAGFRSAARAVQTDDFAEVLELEDGGIYAMRLDEVVEPTLQPLDDVRDAVVDGWTVQATGAALTAQAEALADQLRGGVDPADLGLWLTSETALTRDAFVEDAPEGFVAAAFELVADEVKVLPGDGSALILRLTDVLPPDLADEDTADLAERLEDRIAQAIAQDIFAAYAADLQAKAGLSLNQSALNAVHAQIP